MDEITKLIDNWLEDGLLNKDDYEIILKKAESVELTEEELNLLVSKRVQLLKMKFENYTRNGKSKSTLPYAIAIIAVVMTLLLLLKVFVASETSQS